jgi:DNA-binding HxlR family transcriptional regulator
VPPRVEYALTEKGLALLPIIDDMRTYGTLWLGADCGTEQTAREIAPPAIAAA